MLETYSRQSPNFSIVSISAQERLNVNESEELSCALGAFERVVCEVCEVALDGSFVGKYHI